MYTVKQMDNMWWMLMRQCIPKKTKSQKKSRLFNRGDCSVLSVIHQEWWQLWVFFLSIHNGSHSRTENIYTISAFCAIFSGCWSSGQRKAEGTITQADGGLPLNQSPDIPDITADRSTSSSLHVHCMFADERFHTDPLLEWLSQFHYLPYAFVHSAFVH